MTIRITAISKPEGNPSHAAITELKWIDDANGKTGTVSREYLYNWIKSGNKAFVKDRANDVAYVETRENLYGTKFVQTYADRTWKDNLLALPRF
jgi:hypothetical protein